MAVTKSREKLEVKTSFSYWSFEGNLQRALTMGGCINKHGGLKTSCAWPARFMSRVYGERWQLLSFNTSSLRRSENLAQRDFYSSLVAHLRLEYALPPSSSPPAWWSTGHSGFSLILNAAHRAALLLDLPPWRQLYRHIPLGGSKCPDSTEQPSIGEQAVAPEEHSDVHLCSQISICDWNPAVNKPSGPSSALRLQLGLQNLLSYLALLNSAWTIIPGELSERAKEFSLYI